MNMMATPPNRVGVAPAPVEVAADSRGNLAVGGTRKTFRDDFGLTGAGLAAIDQAAWTATLGNGMTLAAANSVLTINTGASANTETVLLCNERFSAPLRALLGLQLSAKVAGEQVILELLACDAAGVPIETEKAHVGSPLAGTSTSSLERVTVDASNTVTTTAAGPTFTTTPTSFEVVVDTDEIDLCSGTLNASARTFIEQRQHNIPDPNATYALRIRIRHDGTYASAGQTVQLFFVLVADTAEVQAEIVGGRGTSSTVQVSGTVAVSSGTVTARSSASNTGDGATSFNRLVSAASTNATNVAGAATAICGVVAANTSASWRYLKLYNKATAPTPGTDTPVLTIPLPPGQTVIWNPDIYPRLTNGLGFAITAGAADNDATAIGAGEVVLSLMRP